MVLTREEDRSAQNENRTDGTSPKKSDLIERVKLMQAGHGDIFVSIHMNNFSNPKYRGAQVFYAAKNEESKRLGGSLQKALAKNLDDGFVRDSKAVTDEIYILKNATIPSVLVECGFISNPSEAALLQSPEYQNKLAWSIYMGIVDYFLK